MLYKQLCDVVQCVTNTKTQRSFTIKAKINDKNVYEFLNNQRTKHINYY